MSDMGCIANYRLRVKCVANDSWRYILFAIESEITRAFEKPSWRGLGFLVIHVGGQGYGIKSPGQSMLACSFDEVGARITGRGTHHAPFAEAAAIEIANA
jgi:hypothetical protein